MDQHWDLLMSVVLAASAVLGFVLQITTYEDADRARKTQVGTLGGLLIGSLASAQQNGNLTVAFVGFLGGGIGALLGWSAALGISYWAVKRESGRGVLVFLNGGPSGVNTYMIGRDDERKRFAVNQWSQRYGQMVRRCREELAAGPPPGDAAVEMMLRVWLTALVDPFNYLMVDTANPTINQYHLRASLIRFPAAMEPVEGQPPPEGRHWIAYSGTAPQHNMASGFGPDSIAHGVAAGTIASPWRVSPTANAAQEPGEKRKDASYRAYAVSRVNGRLVLTIDWEVDTIGNQYLDILEAIVDGYLVGQIADLVTLHGAFH